jgi:hypothetical protein
VSLMAGRAVSGVFGIQYKIAPHFLDQRGALIEAALDLFAPADDIEIELGAASAGLPPDQILLRRRDVAITINPVKTVVQYGPDSLEVFRSGVEKFVSRMQTFYKKNQFEFVGVVYRVQGAPSSQESLAEVFPIFEESFVRDSGGIVASRVTYLRGNYRIHLTLELDRVVKRWQLDFDTQRILTVSLDEAPLLVDECWKLLQDFLRRNNLLVEGGK